MITQFSGVCPLLGIVTTAQCFGDWICFLLQIRKWGHSGDLLEEANLSHLTRSVLFWDITQCIVVIPYSCFRTTYQSHLQSSRIT